METAGCRIGRDQPSATATAAAELFFFFLCEPLLINSPLNSGAQRARGSRCGAPDHLTGSIAGFEKWAALCEQVEGTLRAL